MDDLFLMLFRNLICHDKLISKLPNWIDSKGYESDTFRIGDK